MDPVPSPDSILAMFYCWCRGSSLGKKLEELGFGSRAEHQGEEGRTFMRMKRLLSWQLFQHQKWSHWTCSRTMHRWRRDMDYPRLQCSSGSFANVGRWEQERSTWWVLSWWIHVWWDYKHWRRKASSSSSHRSCVRVFDGHLVTYFAVFSFILLSRVF